MQIERRAEGKRRSHRKGKNEDRVVDMGGKKINKLNETLMIPEIYPDKL